MKNLHPGLRIKFKENYLSSIWACEVPQGATGTIANVHKNEPPAPELRVKLPTSKQNVTKQAPYIEVTLDEPLFANGAPVKKIYFTRGLGGDGLSSFEDVENFFSYYCEADHVNKNSKTSPSAHYNTKPMSNI